MFLDDGLTACPICSKRMKEAEVFSHLDVHNEPQSSTNGGPSGSRYEKLHLTSEEALIMYRGTPIEIGSRSRPPSKPMERLPQISYGLMKDNALRKKLAELGIPNGGPRPLLIKRHTEWVNLVNSNCDSSRPRTKRELLSELDTWERSQGRNIINGLGGSETSSVMRKDFDSAAWASNHTNDFQLLIAKARQKAKIKSAEQTQVNGGNGRDDQTAEGRQSQKLGSTKTPSTAQNGDAPHHTASSPLDLEEPPNLPVKLVEDTDLPQRHDVDGIIDLRSDG